MAFSKSQDKSEPVSASNPHPFARHQIVCLEQQGSQLFGEVVDVIELRQLVWVRPWVLLTRSPAADWQTLEPSQIADVREGSHLLWPIAGVRAALDTELLPLLGYLSTTDPPPYDDRLSAQLHKFVRALWHNQRGKSAVGSRQSEEETRKEP